MHSICGYVVLRKPMFNFDENGRGAFNKTAPCIRDTYYSGVSRMAWFDLDEYYFDGMLPQDLIKLRDKIINENQDFSDIIILRDLQDTKDILCFSNQEDDKNELCAVFSESLAKQKGVIEFCSDIVWLGIDVYCQGYGSLIEHGVFTNPDLFSEFCMHLNNNGLFDMGSTHVNKYIEKYIEFSKSNNIESVYEVIDLIDIISVARVAPIVG